jgi:hypothetical protein
MMEAIAAGQMPEPQDYAQTMLQAQQDAARQEQAAAGARAGAAAGQNKLYADFLAQPRPDVYKPQYKPMPKAPSPQYRSPLEAVGSPLAALALVAGLFTRNPATATLGAAAAAMDAQRAGDQVGYENAHKEFRDNLDLTMKANEQERQAYLDSWNDRNKTMQERMADLEMKATMYRNNAVAGAARSGNVSEAQMSLNAMGQFTEYMKALAPQSKNPNENLARAFEDVKKQVSSEMPGAKPEEILKETNRRLEDAGMYNPSDSSKPGEKQAFEAYLAQERQKTPEDPTGAYTRAWEKFKSAGAAGKAAIAAKGEDVLKIPELKGVTGQAALEKIQELDPAFAGNIRAILDYKQPLPSANSRSSGAKALRDGVFLVEPNYDAKLFPVINQTEKDFHNYKQQSAPGFQILSGRTLVGHIHSMVNATKALQNSGYRSINDARIRGASVTQFPALREYEIKQAAVSGELDRFLGGKAATVTGTKHWRELMDPKATPQEMERAAKALYDIFAVRFKEIGNVYNMGVNAVDEKGNADPNNPRYKPWEYWLGPQWSGVAESGGAPAPAAAPPASGGGGVIDFSQLPK